MGDVYLCAYTLKMYVVLVHSLDYYEYLKIGRLEIVRRQPADKHSDINDNILYSKQKINISRSSFERGNVPIY